MTTSRRTRRSALAAAALVATAGTTLALTQVAAADQPLRLATVSVDGADTGIDLGTPGLSPGDTDVFLDDVQRSGQTIGAEAGRCTVVIVSDSRLVAACTATLMLPEGQLAVEGVNDEDPQVGPTGFVWAVTGGTGRYAAARGEVVGTFRPDTGSDTDTVDLEVRLR
jgi:hypothetical protein